MKEEDRNIKMVKGTYIPTQKKQYIQYWKWILGVGLVLVVSYICDPASRSDVHRFQKDISNWWNSLNETDIPAPPPYDIEDTFVHPYDGNPWWKRWTFRIKRTFTLVYIWTPFVLASLVMLIKKDDKNWREYWIQLMLSSMERAGCVFQKFGQWLSMRPDLFSSDIIEALGHLRDQSPTHNIEHTSEEIKKSFGADIDEIFESFDEVPIASGTIAQVHRAQLRSKNENGDISLKDVAVKVRHPNVIDDTYMDMEVVSNVMDLMCSILYIYLPWEREEFYRHLQTQLDLEWEAYNLEVFAKNFQNEKGIIFPTVIKNLVSPSVLVETWLEGYHISNLFQKVQDRFGWGSNPESNQDPQTTIKKKKMARELFDMTAKMWLRDNCVHGDLHAGNVLCLSDSNKIGIIDPGLVIRLHTSYTQPVWNFMKAMCIADYQQIASHLLEFNTKNNFPENREQFYSDIRTTVENYSKDSIIPVGNLLGELFWRAQQHGLILPGEVATSLMTLSHAEGLIRQLDPEFNIARHAVPYFGQFTFS